jgi:hypothetical protein
MILPTDMTDDEALVSAMLLGCRFMTEKEKRVPGYGPWDRFMTSSGWGQGYGSKHQAARAYLLGHDQRGRGFFRKNHWEIPE